MDQKELSFAPCYKLNFSSDEVDLNGLIDKLSDIGDILFDDGQIYLWLDRGLAKEDIKKVFLLYNIDEFYFEKIFFNLDDTVSRNPTSVQLWWAEHYNANFKAIIEDNCQDILQKINDNILKATVLIDEKKAALKK